MTFRPDAFWPTLQGGLEDEYRATTDERERQVVMVGAATVLVASIAFNISDWLLDGPERFQWTVAGARILLASVALGTWIVFRARAPRRTRDRGVVLLLFSLVLVDLGAAASHDAAFTANFMLSPMLVLAIYVTLGATARASMAAALIDTGGSLVIAFGFRQLSSVDLLTITLAFAIANFLGIVLLQWLRKSGREAFVALRAESESKRKLQTAIDELSTLRGIVPICSACKKIRDDEGYWHQVEIYVQKHSQAQFTHGLCPTCLPAYAAELNE